MSVRLALLFGVVACVGGDGATGLPPRPPAASLPYASWVTTTEGTMPLVIIAPHGGDLTPGELPDRSCSGCIVGNDGNTQELAYQIADAFDRRIGRRPFLVVNRLHRRKFDANRDVGEATGGNIALSPFWQLFHDRIDSAKARALQQHARALVIDLHGHAHSKQRLELGYLLSAQELRLDARGIGLALTNSSIAQLAALQPASDTGVLLIRGPRALGSRYAALRVPAVPSDADPAPLVADPFFPGGFNTSRHGSRLGGRIDAIQIEVPGATIRNTAADRERFAEASVTALLGFLRDYYGWQVP